MVAGGGIGLYLWSDDSATPTPRPIANPPTTSTTNGSTPSTGLDSTTTTRSSGLVAAEPTISDWQVVADPRTSLAYDVPAQWKVESPSTVVGFEDDVPEDDSSAPTPDTEHVSLSDNIESWCASITVDTVTGDSAAGGRVTGETDDDDDCAAPELKFATVSFTPVTVFVAP